MLRPSVTPVNRFQLLVKTGQTLVYCFTVLSSGFNSCLPGMLICPFTVPFVTNILIPDLPGTY